MRDLFTKTRRAIYSLMFAGGIALAAQSIPKNFEEPQPLSPPPVELTDPHYCSPGIEADRYKINMKDTTYRLIVKYDLEIEEIIKYNSNCITAHSFNLSNSNISFI